MGILNKKTRIVDAIITKEGRSQMGKGGLDFRFYSFNDRDAFYHMGDNKEKTGLDFRPILESHSRFWDRVLIENNDEGRLIDFTGGPLRLLGNKILSGSTQSERSVFITGSVGTNDDLIFSSLLEQVASGSVSNFNNIRAIGTKRFQEDQEFKISPLSHTFLINNDVPINTYLNPTEASINAIEPVFIDKNLSTLDNFKFLPPVLPKTSQSKEGDPVGQFENINQKEIEGFEDILDIVSNKEKITVDFIKSSRRKTFIFQIFESSTGTDSEFLKKLDIVDAGEYFYDEKMYSVFFAGLIFIDEYGISNFVNIFTFIFSR